MEEAEVWHHVTDLDRLNSEGQERLLEKVQHRRSGDPSILEMPIHGATAKDSSYGVEPV